MARGGEAGTLTLSQRADHAASERTTPSTPGSFRRDGPAARAWSCCRNGTPTPAVTSACRGCSRGSGISALRLSLPYHDRRMPPELHPRRLHRQRQRRAHGAGLPPGGARRAAGDRGGCAIRATSASACSAPAWARASRCSPPSHEPLVRAQALNHVSPFFADVVWRGLSTRTCAPVSTATSSSTCCATCGGRSARWSYLERSRDRRTLLVYARYDLTFPVDLSRAARATSSHASVSRPRSRCCRAATTAPAKRRSSFSTRIIWRGSCAGTYKALPPSKRGATKPVAHGWGVESARAPVMDARISRQSSLGSLSVSLVGIVGILAVVIAGATIWLLLTDPVTVAESVDAGEVSPLVRSLAGADLRSAARVAQVPLVTPRARPFRTVPPCSSTACAAAASASGNVRSTTGLTWPAKKNCAARSSSAFVPMYEPSSDILPRKEEAQIDARVASRWWRRR